LTSSQTALTAVDFELDSLEERLVQAGFDRSRPAIVSWLGVTVYLTRAAIGATLDVVAGFAPGTELILDYMVPAQMRDTDGQSYAELVMPVTAERGEPWLTFLTPQDMCTLLEDRGFGRVEHIRQRDTVDAAVWLRTDSLRPSNLSVLARATVR
jgi:O-methyltransferase involved in polyketide biosynthesis